MNRRSFLKTGAAAVASVTALGVQPRNSRELIDVNVNLSRWPLRRLPSDDVAALVSKLRSHGVTQAWAGTFDGLLHKDLASANSQLAQDCRRHGRGLLLPFGSINPKAADWEEELRRCDEAHHMRGIRLHPNYHGYKLDDSDFARLLGLSAKRRLIVQIALVMEDERMMHPLLRVEPVDTAPLSKLMKQTPGLRIVLLNALRTLRAKPLLDVLSSGDVSVEISNLEGVGGISKLLAEAPESRVLFGSHAPLFYFEAALFKMKESPLTAEQERAIRFGNAQGLLAQKH